MPTYYTPNINEFKIGLEFEYLNTITKEWHPILVNEGDRVETYWVIFSSYAVRVKHLDHDDIVDCGWEYQGKQHNGRAAYLFNQEYWMEYQVESNHVFIDESASGFFDSDSSDSIFHGTILNKSELLFQMERLGIKK